MVLRDRNTDLREKACVFLDIQVKVIQFNKVSYIISTGKGQKCHHNRCRLSNNKTKNLTPLLQNKTTMLTPKIINRKQILNYIKVLERRKIINLKKWMVGVN